MRGEVVGRTVELGAATALLDTLGEGPLALIIEGEAGIGKTTVWRAAATMAAERGARVLTARPAEPEAQLAFAALADLLEGVPAEDFDSLPAPQHRALDVALLRAEPYSGGIDARAASAGTAALLRGLAADGPLVVAIDDVQWLDPASSDALTFAARRLGASRIGLVVAVRPSDVATPFGLDTVLPASRLTRVRLGPLSTGALYHLFAARLGHSFPRSTIVRIAEASGGNPFYALEIGRAMLDGGRRVAGAPMPVPASVRGLAGDRIRRLPASTREGLLRVAALARPTSALVDVASLGPAEAAGLVEIDLDGHIKFSHPLFAAAVYGDATATERRAVHRDLAAAVNELEERARHEALAATGPDPAVAELLTEAGSRARARGATAAAADLVELALQLTPPDADADVRLRREIDLAGHLHLAGQPARAQMLLEAAITAAEPGDLRDEGRLSLAMICRDTDPARAIAVCEEALAHATEPAILARAHATLAYILEILDVAQATEHSAAAAVLFAELGDTASWSYATLGHCWHELLLGHGPDEEAFRRALETAPMGGRPADLWWSELAPVAPVWVLAHDDFAGARALFAGALEQARQEGNEAEIGLLFAVLAQIDCWLGQPQAADDEAAEAVELARLGGSPATLADALRVQANIDAIRGRLERARDTVGLRLAELGIADAGRLVYATGVVLGFVAHSIGDEAQADQLYTRTSTALRAAGILEMPGYTFLGDHVEAVLALGDFDRAEAMVADLDARARAFPRPWTLAVGARCRGLVLAARGDLDGAAEVMDTALAHHERLDSPYELGRTLMAKAQVHRRRTEKRLARDALTRAVELLDRAGAEVWAQRARTELGRLRVRTAPTELTETELRIAELAAGGRTNREIASMVFVSPKTVEARLASVYGKLGIRSRAELGAWMAGRTASKQVGQSKAIS
jgi:DNA-binding CsgD family transcriptional regulator